MKTCLAPLISILAGVDASEAEKSELSSKLADIRAERDQVIAEASGPDDKAALEKLNALASRDTLANSRLQIVQRQCNGAGPAAVNEAVRVRARMIELLAAERAAEIGKIREGLSAAYPDANDLDRAVSHLLNGKTPERLHKISKYLTALNGQTFPNPTVTELQFARTIHALSAAAEQLL